MADGYELVFAFRDQSPNFVHGFTCGRIWQQMKGRERFNETVPDSLREDVIAMATATGWREEIIELGDGWLSVTFLREPEFSV